MMRVTDAPRRSRLALAGWAGAGGLTAVILGALLWGLLHPASKPTPNLVGRPAPPLTIRSLEGREIRLADLRGTPVVLNFWASWCVPCRQEAPVLADSARASEGRVQFLGLDIQDSDAAARAYEAEVRSPYPVGPAIEGSYVDFGVDKPPQTLFIDRRGVVAARFVGPIDAHSMKLYLSLLT